MKALGIVGMVVLLCLIILLVPVISSSQGEDIADAHKTETSQLPPDSQVEENIVAAADTYSEDESEDSFDEASIESAEVLNFPDTGNEQESTDKEEATKSTGYTETKDTVVEEKDKEKTVEEMENADAEKEKEECESPEPVTLAESEPEVAAELEENEEETVQEETEVIEKATIIEEAKLSADEEAMLQLINNLRREEGLKPLEIDAVLVDVARIKVVELIELDYFSHFSPVYGSPEDMLRHFNVSFSHMGENLAMNLNVESAYRFFLDSPPHLANILNPGFSHIGVGIKKNNCNYMYVTLIFIEAKD